jgi:predicted ATP-dependent serine protease
VATGIDPKRLAVLLAVLERRAQTSFVDLDVFLQVTAGVRLTEPGADLAVAAALLSSLYNRPAPTDVIFLGEIGLGGEIRPTAGLERRVQEAARLGFRRRTVGSGACRVMSEWCWLRPVGVTVWAALRSSIVRSRAFPCCCERCGPSWRIRR